MKIQKDIMAFGALVFLLLGILFGTQIMAFIFGNLGPTQAGLTSTDAAWNASTAIQNNSLAALQTYSSQANTQMNTIGITITLLILVSLFAIFWKLFVGKKAGSDTNFG